MNATPFSRVMAHALCVAILIHCNLTLAQETSGAAPDRAGKHFIAAQVSSLEEDRQVLGWFDGLRVADVCDGMDMAGDVIVADGDGVLVVPRAKVEAVARYARKTLDADKTQRRRAYDELGMPTDQSVE